MMMFHQFFMGHDFVNAAEEDCNASHTKFCMRSFVYYFIQQENCFLGHVDGGLSNSKQSWKIGLQITWILQ